MQLFDTNMLKNDMKMLSPKGPEIVQRDLNYRAEEMREIMWQYK